MSSLERLESCSIQRIVKRKSRQGTPTSTKNPSSDIVSMAEKRQKGWICKFPLHYLFYLLHRSRSWLGFKDIRKTHKANPIDDVCQCQLINKDMFGWVRNNRIAIVLGIGIAVVYPNTNLLFRNSKNNYYSAILW
jgi:hypothetical protein